MKYHTRGGGGSPGGDYGTNYDANITLQYDGHAWSGTCTLETRTSYRVYSNGTSTYTLNNSTETRAVNFPPMRAPASTSIGETPPIPILSDCERVETQNWPVTEQTTHTAPRRSTGSAVWHAHYHPAWPAEGDAWWDTKTSLLLAWDDQRSHGANHGWMVDTDAPLS